MDQTAKIYLEKDNERELRFEILTKRYMLGEIDLKEYRENLSDFETRLDLRKVASRLKQFTGSKCISR